MNSAFPERRLGKSGVVVGAMGVGTWAIGGPCTAGAGFALPTGTPLGYGQVDDAKSVRAIERAVDLGARFFDTADSYGAGHAERVLAQALGKRRDGVVIATKFGNTFDEAKKELTGTDVSPTYIRRACQASLKRLQTDWIDLYQLHIGDVPVEAVGEVADALDRLCDDGLIRAYGWSTDDPERAAAFGQRPHAVATQFNLNVLEDAPAMLETCDAIDHAAIARLPLAMGLLSGKYTHDSRLPGDDIRSRPPAWLQYFDAGGGVAPEWEARLASVREVLSSGGRSLVQGALAWIWARSPRTIPIPGARTLAQVEENLGAIAYGPLGAEQMREVDALLGRAAA